MPPTKTVETHPTRELLEALRVDLAIKVPATVADGHAVAFGDVLGLISASSKLRRRTRTTVDTTAFATNSMTGKVADASIFKDSDVLKNAAGATIGTIAVGGINLTTRVLTLTANAAVAVADGAAVLGSDGSEVAKAFADQDSDGEGDTPIAVIIAGPLKESKLRGLDATAKTELSGRSTVGGIFIF